MDAQSQEEGAESLVAQVRCGCELARVGTGKHLCNNVGYGGGD